MYTRLSLRCTPRPSTAGVSEEPRALSDRRPGVLSVSLQTEWYCLGMGLGEMFSCEV